MIAAWLQAILDAQLLLWREFSPAWWAAIVAGATLPALGVQVAFRGQALTTLAIPQVSFAAMALALAIPGFALTDAHEPSMLVMLAAAFAGALLGGLLAGQRQDQHAPLRMGAVFVGAWALTETVRALSPVGEMRLEPLLHGELLGASPSTAGLVALLVLPCAVILALQRRLSFCAAFPDAALAAGLNTRRLERGLALMLGAAIALGTVTLGPLVTAALLLLPAALAARNAPSAISILRRAMLTGVLAALLGSIASVLADIPLGAAIALACVPIGLCISALQRR